MTLLSSSTQAHSTLMGWLADQFGATPEAIELSALPGATSSDVFRVSISSAVKAAAVLRVFSNDEWLAREPDLVIHEAAALNASHGLTPPAPDLVAFHEGGRDLPPVILMSELSGEVWLPLVPDDDWLAALAECLTAIHTLSVGAFEWRHSSWTRPEQLVLPDWSARSALWQEAMDRFREPAPVTEDVFLHRDFHPLNLLWRRLGTRPVISGVVDWVNACLGSAGADLAHCRLNLAVMYGLDTANRFLSAYKDRNPDYQHFGHFDIEVVLGTLPAPQYYEPWKHFGLPGIAEKTLRARIEALLENALRSA